ncbi:MAG: hypothetical protein U0S50_00860 [Sphingopyxis sp.]|uniref:hypothetical protein n=1 Tax=Sphingopyxis sp. TaxID=1908224 RepID=UPI002ABAC4A4|nr:hypothetical protein [Sphingopyxis sp.]MDZ3830349.1 hypothetical protein [Sphingopyxis sp.]
MDTLIRDGQNRNKPELAKEELSDALREAVSETRARIEIAFSRQIKIATRLKNTR